ncbi:NAD(P)H-quinone dehydrogenase [Streptomyces clavuligerus]|uniref:NAD(P)H-quinone dehydrogenase n=1 Tax=Streptomyces clavuligerus TaxID=1901 RepID=UPI00020D9313|nr:NAD(P)H-quinone dehydrogenase [Streptomyces clavuligerus]MBY6302953.1 NAD(P)H-quinone dehydrogenase [Streptomyces clavuligerus]QCS05805.1 NAD(P)H-quinone dehydrogenase [Streptomyces clavuligerus]QPJ94829.1 SidA/IucD/PvdA family monooxygenase [Streptomyces clavuligerus]WDN53675.1 NAD(P)H-quinone dehydrogenase [Streptomyces clavuligerus]
MTRIVIIGGGPGGYEAALVGAQLGAEVTVVDCDGLGGASVLTDCVPSKTLIATAEVMTTFDSSYEELGIIVADTVSDEGSAAGPPPGTSARVVGVDLGKVNRRVKRLALAQSHDITASVTRAGARVVRGRGRLEGQQAADGSRKVVVRAADGTEETLVADAVLIATGGHPREIPDALPDGERILNWTQVYDLEELPEELIVVGSGVTGAEFAGAYQALGSRVTLVSSRDRVLPGEDPDAAAVLEDVFRRRGMNVMARSRAAAVKRIPGAASQGPSSPDAGPEGRVGDRVEVTLSDGRVISGTHCLMAVGAIPNSAGMGLEEAGVRLKDSGHIWTDRVSRTSAPGVYAAGDVTGVFALASVAAMQGRIAMYHFLGDAVTPLNLKTVSANVFTDPEIATIGCTQADVDAGTIDARVVKLPLLRNPRAKMQGIRDGFVKIFCRPGTGIVVGGCVVAPRASELIHPISIAVDNNLTVEQIANAFTVYPSLSGSIAEVARQLQTRKAADEG